MSNAQNYVPTTSFASEETNQASGRSTVKTVKLDTEFANISDSINGVNSNLKLLQRDDGNLKDLIIRTYSLSEQVRALIAAKGSPKGLWGNATTYEVGDCVEFNNVAYLCHTAHTTTLNFEYGLWTAISASGDAVSSAQQAASSALSASAASNSANLAKETTISAALNAANSANSAISSKDEAVNAAEIASNAAEAAQLAAAAGVGVNAQPLDADLTAIAGLTGSGYPKRNSGGTWQIDQFASIENDSVTTLKIVNNSVTQEKLAPEIGTSATQPEAEAGTLTALRWWSPLRIKQAIVALIPAPATQAESEAGNEAALRLFSPLRIKQAIVALAPTPNYPVTSVNGMTGAVIISLLGFGQTWQNLSGSRSTGITYTNSTGKPISISVILERDDGFLWLTVDGLVIAKIGQTAGPAYVTVTAIIPNGSTYSVDNVYVSGNLYWYELR